MCLMDTATSVPEDRNWEDFMDFLVRTKNISRREAVDIYIVYNIEP